MYWVGFLTPTAPPMTNATATKAIQPQIAVLRCCALQRPARAAKVLACTRCLLGTEREVVWATRSYASQCAKRSTAGPCGSLAYGSGVSPTETPGRRVPRCARVPVPHIRLRGTGVDPTHMRAEIVDAMEQVRRRTLDLVGHLSAVQLERQVDPIMSPLVWDLAHIAAYEDLWLVHRFGGRPLLRPDLPARYDAFETPRAVRGEIELFDTPGAQAYLDAVRARALETLDGREPDPVIHEMVIRHELHHTETMRQAMELGGLLPAGEPSLRLLDGADDEDWVTVPAG